MAKVFYIVPGSMGVSVLLAFLAVLFSFVGYITRAAPGLVSVLLLLFMSCMVAVFGYFLYSSRRTTFTVSEKGLTVSHTMYGRTIPASDLRAQDAKILDLTKEAAYRSQWRTNGLGLPDYTLGWFILRNREKALTFLTDRRKVVYIPTRSGFSILLSTPSPEAFLRALRENQEKPVTNT